MTYETTADHERTAPRGAPVVRRAAGDAGAAPVVRAGRRAS